jgi:hypothetical protein
MNFDAEGSEPAVLRGAKGSLDLFRPYLILEINGVVLQAGCRIFSRGCTGVPVNEGI